MAIKIKNYECGCKQKLYYNNGNLNLVEWLNFCDKHREVRKRL
jgi:hypothetical protein